MRQIIRELSRRRIAFLVVVLALLLVIAIYVWDINTRDNAKSIDSFAECVAAGNPIMESYPEQCVANGQSFSNPAQSIQ